MVQGRIGTGGALGYRDTQKVTQTDGVEVHREVVSLGGDSVDSQANIKQDTGQEDYGLLVRDPELREIKDVIRLLLVEQRITNAHLSILTEMEFKGTDVDDTNT